MNQASEKGMVSIIVVMFTSLLLIVISVGFIRIMSQEEGQASDNNLSQSAYDAAVSGVEDAKRVITACNNGSTVACEAITRQQCNTVQAAGIVASTSDTNVAIRSSGMTESIRGQAYTCVTITSKTDDVKYTLEEGVSEVIPLTSTADSRYIKLEWTLKGEDMPTIAAPGGPTTFDSSASLPQKAAWGTNAPALLRVQLVAAQGGSVSQEDFDGSQVMTAFLRPIAVTNLASDNSASLQPLRAAASGSNVTTYANGVTCSKTDFDNNKYACAVYLDLGDSRSVHAGSKISYMRVTSLYNRTQFKMSFQNRNNETLAQFDGVQPLVDSTGRAGDVYRRVSSRVSPDTKFAYPEYAVDITGSLCKDFSVTDTASLPGECVTRPVR